VSALPGHRIRPLLSSYAPPAILPDEPQPPTAALIPRVLAGDEAAARELIDRLHPLVLKLVRSHRSRRTAEEDLCQMIFVRIFRRLEQYSGAVPLEHWVSRVAINCCLNQIESERVRPELRHADLSAEQIAVLDHLAATSAELPGTDSAAARELVGHLLDQLDPPDRLVIQLLHLDERSVEEISAITGWSRPMVKVRAFRARGKLRRAYEKLQHSTPTPRR
jgi:RNA polymerase sigma-70 factor (ECF subfamily)